MHFLMTKVKKIAVVGIGNVLTGDDALGPYIIKRIDSAFRFSPNVVLIEAGTPGLDLTALFFGFDVLIIVDTVRARGRPGDIKKFTRDSLVEKPPAFAISPHDPGLREALLTLQIAQSAPQEVVLVGVIPENLELGLELSESVERAVPQVIQEVLAELVRFGVTADNKYPAEDPDIWWKKAVCKE
jgi:hydrogenase maturation protease